MTRQLLSAGALLLALGLGGLPAAGEDKKDSKDDKKWTALFNGKDLTGWKLPDKPNEGAIKEVVPVEKGGKVVAYEGKLKNDTQVPLWRVEDGILIGSGPASHLFSEKGDYTNFRYRVEAMINDHGNSGQYFRARFGGGFPKGYEAQINATHSDDIRTGSLYPSFGLSKADAIKEKILVLDDAPHKPDEWFTQEVIAEGNHIVIKVNGKTTVDWKDPKETYLKGHFALQGHDPGTVVKFRKVEVIELPAPKDEK
ncbi:MAG TPA: DUF1080 domain-containing protein [Gemmataceae bacterium]|nr:DUF1080 domain-containing protein [Gemmataceae bacterium]